MVPVAVTWLSSTVTQFRYPSGFSPLIAQQPIQEQTGRGRDPSLRE
jgi:hypothetical protein